MPWNAQSALRSAGEEVMDRPYVYWAAAVAVVAALMILLFSTYSGGLVGP
jgi:uncharacterized membrane protein YdfJ with MMPL/SSD domain